MKSQNIFLPYWHSPSFNHIYSFNSEPTSSSSIIDNRLEQGYLLHHTSITLPYAALSVKSTFPALTSAPPIHVLVNGVSPQTALAALTHPSHLPFVISIVCPEVAALSVNFAVPDSPVVVVGSPPHCSIVPAIPPQMARRATLIS